jgi:predicted nucleic acid-binding protein
LGLTFIDSNVIVYANDARDPVKQRLAIEQIATHMRRGSGVISVQVLEEYASVALAKLKQPAKVVLVQLSLLEYLHVVELTAKTVRRAVELGAIHGISFWDACIISSAEEAGCGTILSEDLNPGQSYAGIRVKNPFVQK